MTSLRKTHMATIRLIKQADTKCPSSMRHPQAGKSLTGRGGEGGGRNLSVTSGEVYKKKKKKAERMLLIFSFSDHLPTHVESKCNCQLIFQKHRCFYREGPQSASVRFKTAHCSFSVCLCVDLSCRGPTS